MVRIQTGNMLDIIIESDRHGNKRVAGLYDRVQDSIINLPNPIGFFVVLRNALADSVLADQLTEGSN